MDRHADIDRWMNERIASIDQRISERLSSLPGTQPGSRAFSLQTAEGSRGIKDSTDKSFSSTLLLLPRFHPEVPRFSEEKGGGRKFAIIVGVCNYDDAAWARYGGKCGTLRGCVVDARNIYTILHGQARWPDSDIITMTDSLATVANVEHAFESVALAAMPGDTVVYYESSHGGDSPEPCLCLHDGPLTKSLFLKWLSRFRRGVDICVVADACHSGGMARAAGLRPSIDLFVEGVDDGISALLSMRSSEIGANVGWITAASYGESSLDRYDAGTHGGEFTFVFCDGIRDGTCNNGKYGDCGNDCDFLEAWKYAKDIATGVPGSPSTPLCRNPEVCSRVRIPLI